MRSGLKIAICGKGGVGKTTVCAVWAQLFAEDGLEVMAVDADPDANLCGAFGLPSENTPTPLIEMKQLLAERTGTGREAAGAYFKLNPKVRDLPEIYSVKVDTAGQRGANGKGHGSLRVLVLGGITQAGAGCACPEGVFLKALLTHTILQRQELILVDLAAGVEFMGRASVQGIDALVVVVEPGSRSIETAGNIVQMARQLHVKHLAGVINKVAEPQQIEMIKSRLQDLRILGSVTYGSQIQQADLGRKNVFQAGGPLVGELREAKNRLTEMIEGNPEAAREDGEEKLTLAEKRA